MLRTRNLFWLQRRWKGGKERWSTLQRKKKNTDRALESFDDFYGSVYGLRWKNMRAALLSEHKYVAMVNNFGDTEQTCSLLEMDGAINIRSLVQLAKERLDQAPDTLTDAKAGSTGHLVEDRLSAIIKQQERREVATIYPENADREPPQRLQYRESDGDDDADDASSSSDDESGDETGVDAKKSLTEVMRDDVRIDHTRVVQPGEGAGALYEFLPAHTIKGREDWIPESEHYKYYRTDGDFPLNIVPETDFRFPEHLQLYTYEMGNCAQFRSPKKCLTGALSHFLMDGASILPPLLLDVQAGDRVLDACAAPGGKSLLMLQTLHPEQVICNDVQESRLNRLRRVMREYLFDFEERWEGRTLVLSQSDARNLSEGGYDRILVDVPCTTDRHVLSENDNNLFKPTRVKERLRLPELQAGILANCLRLLRPGGSLVYATCSLSPVQNDGVVHMALQSAFSEHGLTATVKDLSAVTRLFADVFRFERPQSLRYGQMVIPFLPANFGPMYFCKLTRDDH